MRRFAFEQSFLSARGFACACGTSFRSQNLIFVMKQKTSHKLNIVDAEL